MQVEIQGEWAAESARGRIDSRILVVTASLIACLAGFACLNFNFGNDDAIDPAMQDPALRAARIESLRSEIERDHRTLEDLITQPGQAADASLHDHPELRAIANRLTEQERLLEAILAMDADDATPAK